MKILLLAITVFFGFEVVAQPGYTNIESKYNWGGAIFKRLHVPAGGYPVSLPGTWNGDGEMRFDSIHRRLYYKWNGVFYGLVDTTELGSNINGIDDVLSLNQALTAARNIDLNSNVFSITGILAGLTIDGSNQSVTIQANDRLTLDVENLILPNLDDDFHDTTDAKLLVRHETTGKVYRTFWPNFGGVGTGLFPTSGTGTATGAVTGDLGTEQLVIKTASFADGLLKITDNNIEIGDVDGGNPKITLNTTTNEATHTADAHTFTGAVTARWKARVGSTTSSATPTINTDVTDIYKLTAQTANITSFSSNLSGSPNDGDILEIQVTGTASRTLAFGASFVASTVSLPTTTSGTTTLTIIFQWYTTSSYGNNRWVCVNSY